jgi:hypothetical protein
MRRWLFAALFALLVSPAVARAQMAWDSPFLMPPRVGDGLGVFLIDVHGGGLGALLTWRAPRWNFGVRAGLADGGRDDIGLIAGIDVNGNIVRESSEVPLDIDWVFGAGLGIDDGARISLPLGLSLGHAFQGGDVTFVPYATPRVVLDAFLGDDDDDPPRGDDDDVAFRFAVDLGLDMRFSPSFLLRFGATVGDREGVALGLVF